MDLAFATWRVASMPYNATVHRRVGSIKPEEFNDHASRLAMLCSDVYKDIGMELVRDGSVPIGWVWLGADGSVDDTPWTADAAARSNALFDGTFSSLFTVAKMIELRVLPHDSRLAPSIGVVTWYASRPDTLRLRARDTGPSDTTSLERKLKAEMFRHRTTVEKLKFRLIED